MGRADPRAVIGKLLSVRQSVALAGSVNRRLRSEFDGRRKSHPLIMCAGLSVITANAPGIVAYPRTEEEVAALLDVSDAGGSLMHAASLAHLHCVVMDR